MFKIFRRRKDRPALTYGVMQYLNNVVERRQRQLASYLNQRTKNYGKKKWLMLLCGFCLLFGGMTILIFYNGMPNEQQIEKKFRPQSISVPSSILPQGKVQDTLEILEEIYRHRKDSVFVKQNRHH